MVDKTAKEMAEKEVNKRLAKAIANRQLEVRKYQAKIKKLEKEIEKIESGELVPSDEDEDSSSHNPVIIERKEEHHHHHYPKKEKEEDNGWFKKYKPTRYWTGTYPGTSSGGYTTTNRR